MQALLTGGGDMGAWAAWGPGQGRAVEWPLAPPLPPTQYGRCLEGDISMDAAACAICDRACCCFSGEGVLVLLLSLLLLFLCWCSCGEEVVQTPRTEVLWSAATQPSWRALLRGLLLLLAALLVHLERMRSHTCMQHAAWPDSGWRLVTCETTTAKRQQHHFERV